MSELEPQLPTIFFGHGSPMEALGGRFADVWRELGSSLPRPKAVLMISAHWFIDSTSVTAMAKPRTTTTSTASPSHSIKSIILHREEPLAGRARRPYPRAELRRPRSGLGPRPWRCAAPHVPRRRHLRGAAQHRQDQPPTFHFELGRRLRHLRDEGIRIAGRGMLFTICAPQALPTAPVLRLG